MSKGGKRGVSLCITGIFFAACLILFLNYQAKNILDGISSCNKYEFTAVTPGGEKHELICFEGGNGFDKEFILNYRQASFSRLLLRSKKKLSTEKPIECMDMYPDPLPDNPGHASPRDDNRKEVAFIGGDYVSGIGVRPEKRFPSVVKKLCESGKKCTVKQAGFHGANIKDIYENSFKNAVASGADEIVYVMTPADIQVYIDSPEFFSTPNSGVFLSPILPPERSYPPLLEYIIYGINVRFEKTRETVWLKAGYSHMNYAGTQELEEYLRRMKKEAQAGDVRFSCAIFPYMTGGDFGRYPFRPIHGYISDILKAENIPSSDLSRHMLSGDYPGRQVSRCDYRPGPGAHEKAGKSLYGFLMKMPEKKHASGNTDKDRRN